MNNATLRERVARAIWARNESASWDAMGLELERSYYLEDADAVLAELGLAQAEPVAWVEAQDAIFTAPPWRATNPILYSRQESPTMVPLYAAPQPQAALLTNPYTGTPRDYRDVESDPAGVLIQEPGAPLRAAPPRPQASAEDVMFVDELLRQSGLAGPTIKDAWQRIRASLGVVK
jgi:hypothetical protein